MPSVYSHKNLYELAVPIVLPSPAPYLDQTLFAAGFDSSRKFFYILFIVQDNHDYHDIILDGIASPGDKGPFFIAIL